MTIVIAADMIALGYCSKGVREWFKQNGLDYPSFVKNGIDAELLAQTGDAMILRAIDVAKNREAKT